MYVFAHMYVCMSIWLQYVPTRLHNIIVFLNLNAFCNCEVVT